MTSRAVSARAMACATVLSARLPSPTSGFTLAYVLRRTGGHSAETRAGAFVGRVLSSGRLLWEGSSGQRKAGATNRRCGPCQGGSPMKYRCAILDDYQNVALSYADWPSLAPEVDIKVFNQPFRSTEEVHRALQGFQIVCMMRERTAFLRNTLEALPDLKLLITTGAGNKSIDLAAAAER